MYILQLCLWSRADCYGQPTCRLASYFLTGSETVKSAAWTGNLGHVLSKQSKFYHFPVYCTLFQVLLPLWKQLEFVCREVCLYNFRQLQISASDQKNPKDVFGVKPYLWSASPNNCQQSLANHLGIPIFPQKMLHHIQYGGCDTTPVRLL